jgi:hypothetical protein
MPVPTVALARAMLLGRPCNEAPARNASSPSRKSTAPSNEALHREHEPDA